MQLWIDYKSNSKFVLDKVSATWNEMKCLCWSNYYTTFHWHRCENVGKCKSVSMIHIHLVAVKCIILRYTIHIIHRIFQNLEKIFKHFNYTNCVWARGVPVWARGAHNIFRFQIRSVDKYILIWSKRNKTAHYPLRREAKEWWCCLFRWGR